MKEVIIIIINSSSGRRWLFYVFQTGRSRAPACQVSRLISLHFKFLLTTSLNLRRGRLWFLAPELNWEYRSWLGSLSASIRWMWPVHLRFRSMSISVIGARPLFLYISSLDTLSFHVMYIYMYTGVCIYYTNYSSSTVLYKLYHISKSCPFFPGWSNFGQCAKTSHLLILEWPAFSFEIVCSAHRMCSTQPTCCMIVVSIWKFCIAQNLIFTISTVIHVYSISFIKHCILHCTQFETAREGQISRWLSSSYQAIYVVCNCQLSFAGYADGHLSLCNCQLSLFTSDT